MKQRCYFIFGILLLLACEKKVDESRFPKTFEFLISDSVRIEETNGFLSKPSSVKLINDTLIGIESFHSKGIWILHRQTGKEVASIISMKEKGIGFIPAKVFWDEFPIVYILDGTTKRIHQFDLSEEKTTGERHLNTIKLNVPENLTIKPFLINLFIKVDNSFLIEQSTNEVRFSSNKFYQKTGKLIGKYDLEGNYAGNRVDFPEELLNLEKFISPGKIFSSGKSKDESLYISFPFSRTIEKYATNDELKKIETIHLPKSRNFIYDIPYLEEEVNNDPSSPKNDPTPHYFGEFIIEKDEIFIQTFMKDQTNPLGAKIKTHLLKYNLENKQWSESLDPKFFEDFGLIAGTINDTIYIVEAGMINKDEKYIKRAVLKPIED